MKVITNSQKGNTQFSLSAAEARLVRAFRNVSDSTQRMILCTAERCAKDDLLRRHETKNSGLRLVVGGAA